MEAAAVVEAPQVSVLDHPAIPEELRSRLFDAMRRGRHATAADLAHAVAIEICKAGDQADALDILAAAKLRSATATPKAKASTPKTQPEPWRARVIVAADMDESPPPAPTWIVPGLIPAGVVVLAGRPKSGKSIFAMQLAVANCQHGEFLGRPVAGGESLYLDLENGERRIFDRLKVALDGAPLPRNLHLVTEWRRGNREEFARILDERPGVNLAVVDIWSKFRAPINARDDRYQQDELELQWLVAEAPRRRIAIVIIVHLIKSESLLDPYTAVSGSVAVAGNADALLLLKRTQGTERSLRFVGRDLDDTEWLLMPTEPFGFAYRCDASETATPDQTAYLVAIRDAQKPATQAEIARAVGVSRATALEMLRRLAALGFVVNPMGPYSLTEAGKRACAHVSR
jgi:CRP-like cAMP-binding protein